ncbi:MAG: hypothetical protein COB13_012825 [OCS116 cluster bacterium]|uniref:Uncharacterized protein n=1 Tax=OCS116 cluster bacterium TaxID=2030921 RepID=A0A2A4Z4X2_9PROT|nr:hypothetical protein [OCS116 cluster bacterium]
MGSERLGTSRFSRENADLAPLFEFNSAWEKVLRPLKKNKFIDEFGLSLSGIIFKYQHRDTDDWDFNVYAPNSGDQEQLHMAARFIISDKPIQSLPILNDNHKLLVAVEFDGRPSWSAHQRNDKVCRAGVAEQDFKGLVFDTLLDLSFANSFVPDFIFKSMGHDVPTILRKKTKFLLSKYPAESKSIGLNENSPYVSFSNFSRKGGVFGMNEHLENFVSVWGEFFGYLIEDLSKAEIYTKLLLKHPKFGQQLPVKALTKCIENAAPGQYMFVLRKGSKTNVSDSVKGRMYSLFSNLDYRKTGKCEFGLLKLTINPQPNSKEYIYREHIRNLSRENFLYLVRIEI